MSINLQIVYGRLATAPRSGPNRHGVMRTVFRLAYDAFVKDEDRSFEILCIAYGEDFAAGLAAYAPGDKIFLSGSYRTHKDPDKGVITFLQVRHYGEQGNVAIVKGRMGADPDVKSNRVSFSIPTDIYEKNADGESVKTTQWVEVRSFFPKKSEIIGKHFKKGKEITVIGEWQTDRWKDEETQEPREFTFVKLFDFDFSAGEAKAREGGSAPLLDDGEIPF